MKMGAAAGFASLREPAILLLSQSPTRRRRDRGTIKWLNRLIWSWSPLFGMTRHFCPLLLKERSNNGDTSGLTKGREWKIWWRTFYFFHRLDWILDWKCRVERQSQESLAKKLKLRWAQRARKISLKKVSRIVSVTNVTEIIYVIIENMRYSPLFFANKKLQLSFSWIDILFHFHRLTLTLKSHRHPPPPPCYPSLIFPGRENLHFSSPIPTGSCQYFVIESEIRRDHGARRLN